MMDEPALDVTPGRVYLYTALGGRILDTLVYDGVRATRLLMEPPEPGGFGFIRCSQTRGDETVKFSIPVQWLDVTQNGGYSPWCAGDLLLRDTPSGVRVVAEPAHVEVPSH